MATQPTTGLTYEDLIKPGRLGGTAIRYTRLGEVA